MSRLSPKDIVAALPMPALLISSEGRIDTVNAAACSIFGVNALQRHYITVLRQPAVLDAVETAIAQQKPTSAQYVTTEASRDVTLDATIKPLPSGHVLVLFEDRTAMHEAGQMRRNFVANVSHELRTPLTAMTGFIETLRGAARDDAEARERFLKIMEREASRMNRLVTDLLSLSRVEADERVRPTDQVDLAAVVNSVTSTLAGMADAVEVAVATEGVDRVALLPGDADQLAQVATNLIENAIKYAGHGQNVSVRLTHETDNAMLRQDAWVLEVADTGEGIDPLHIPRLTERFYRIDSHRSRELGGTGLGLAIVKHIVNRHRGRFRITSELGKGSVFRVILPASIDPVR
ncbi:MAG: ATP-binding protein [Pseudomonadota bacterium]